MEPHSLQKAGTPISVTVGWKVWNTFLYQSNWRKCGTKFIVKQNNTTISLFTWREVWKTPVPFVRARLESADVNSAWGEIDHV